VAYDYKQELKRVTEYYQGDPLQKRFSALIVGPSGVGKTFLLRTCRKPIHIDSFDPGGTKCLRDLIDSGDVIADTQWEADDPFNPTKFSRWKKAIELRLQIGYFKNFGTYVLDSASTWGDAAMNEQLGSAGHAAETPRRNHDYVPTKTAMQNYIRKLMSLPCDFILTGHLKENEEILSYDAATGIYRKNIEYRFLTIGQAVVTIPLLFDELYVMQTKDSAQGLKRELLIEAQGKYQARSRLKANGKLSPVEPADIKALLKKIGLAWEDKPRLEFE
jgi:hypothetical protein